MLPPRLRILLEDLEQEATRLISKPATVEVAALA